MMMNKITSKFNVNIVLFLVLFTLTSCHAQTERVMFYNVENLFDTQNDSLTQDDDFTPNGKKHWTKIRLEDKIEKISKVILAVGEWNPPAVVGLCEIENRMMLEMLVESPALKKFNYKIIHKDSPDERGIDVAMIYREDLFKPKEYHAIPLINPNDDEFASRDILEVKGKLLSKDVTIYINHWPSKYGGVAATIPHRALAARTLREHINFDESIIIMGDLNDSPTEASVGEVLNAQPLEEQIKEHSLYNLLYHDKGSLKYKSQWSVYDHVIVSDQLFNTFNDVKAEVFRPEFLLTEDKNHGGMKPFRTYIGMKYQAGYSDHLPVFIELSR